MNICTCINPPICGLTNRKYGKQITVPRCTLSVAHDHIDRLRVLSWTLVLVWALVCPMFLRTTSKATIFSLFLLLTLLLEGSILDRVLSLELVKILLHHIGARRTLCPFHVRVLFSSSAQHSDGQ